jgi:hypothetical protein
MGWQQSGSSFPFLREAKRKTVSSEQAMDDVDMGKLVIPVEATTWPARSSFGQPGVLLRNLPQHPHGIACGCIDTGDSHVQDH